MRGSECQSLRAWRRRRETDWVSITSEGVTLLSRFWFLRSWQDEVVWLNYRRRVKSVKRHGTLGPVSTRQSTWTCCTYPMQRAE